MEITKKENIFWQWISWQFFDVPRNILRAWKNFLQFGLYYFSIPLLFKTLFYPWRQYAWSYPRGFDIGKYLETFLSNLISKIIGAIMRTFLIIFGIIYEIFILILGSLFFLLWFLLPLILILGFYYGLQILL